MIQADHYSAALRVLQRLIIHAKARAYEAAESEVGALLNDIELLPEFLGDAFDRTDDFRDMMQGIAEVHPACRYIVEEFEQSWEQESSER